jgi:hypothetical protein
MSNLVEYLSSSLSFSLSMCVCLPLPLVPPPLSEFIVIAPQSCPVKKTDLRTGQLGQIDLCICRIEPGGHQEGREH